MLNKNGWGYRSYVIGSSILLLALLIATFLIIRFYRALSNINGYTYADIEEKLNTRSLDYINEYYKKEINTGVVVISTSKLLKKDMITKDNLINNENKDKCSGYSLIRKNDDGDLVSESYIKCGEYKTSGYQSWRVVDNE